MKTPFLRTLSGKFISRSALTTLIVGLVLAALAIVSLRTLSGTADSAVADAQSPEAAIASLEALAGDVSAASSRLMLLMVGVTVIGTIVAAAIAGKFGRKVTSQVVDLGTAASNSAQALPQLISTQAVPSTELPAELTTGDEIEDLAVSFIQFEKAAVAAGHEQMQMRKHNIERFTTLGQRSQALLADQMKAIDTMEKEETNASNLQRLFEVDHIAAQMRRNVESMLLLVGEDSQHVLQHAIPVHQVVQAASSQVEHFSRVTLSEFSGGASVDGAIATDLAHLIAELVENATQFAAPEAPTEVRGRSAEYGYMIEIIDRGTGMSADDIADANALFADPTRLDAHQSVSLGHDLVARLAHRHSVGVELTATPGGGVTARVHLRHAVLAQNTSAAAPAPGATVPEPTTPPPGATVPEPTTPPPAATVPEPTTPPPVATVPEPTTPPPGASSVSETDARLTDAQQSAIDMAIGNNEDLWATPETETATEPVSAAPVNAGPVTAGPVSAGPVTAGPVGVQAGPIQAADLVSVGAGPVTAQELPQREAPAAATDPRGTEASQ